eukprot:1158779-Pelagomonas_calceolata.AAC.7
MKNRMKPVMLCVHGSTDGVHAASFVQSSSVVAGGLTYSATGVQQGGLQSIGANSEAAHIQVILVLMPASPLIQVLVPLSLLWSFLDNSSKQHVQATLSSNARCSSSLAWSSNDLLTKPGTHLEVSATTSRHCNEFRNALLINKFLCRHESCLADSKKLCCSYSVKRKTGRTFLLEYSHAAACCLIHHFLPKERNQLEDKHTLVARFCAGPSSTAYNLTWSQASIRILSLLRCLKS